MTGRPVACYGVRFHTTECLTSHLDRLIQACAPNQNELFLKSSIDSVDLPMHCLQTDTDWDWSDECYKKNVMLCTGTYMSTVGASGKPDYQCIRCGYNTHRKSHMVQHFSNIKPCPAVLNRIDLTDEIKQDILKNRVHMIEFREFRDRPRVINLLISNVPNNVPLFEMVSIRKFSKLTSQKRKIS